MSTFEKIKSLVSRANSLVDDMQYAQRLHSSPTAEALHEEYATTTAEIKQTVHNLDVEIEFVKSGLTASITPFAKVMNVILLLLSLVPAILGYILAISRPFHLKMRGPVLTIFLVLNCCCVFISVFGAYSWGRKQGRKDIIDIFK